MPSLLPVAIQSHLGAYLFLEDVSVETENLQVRMQNSLSLVIILRIMRVISNKNDISTHVKYPGFELGDFSFSLLDSTEKLLSAKKLLWYHFG